MRRLVFALGLLLSACWSVNALAENIGVVDMNQVLQTSPQYKALNEKLDKQFSGRRDAFLAENKSMQADIKKLQRDQSVMSKKASTALNATIAKKGTDLRSEQAQLQKDIMAAQNTAMTALVEELKGVVQTVAKKKGLDIILLKDAVVSSGKSTDITADVMAKLK